MPSVLFCTVGGSHQPIVQAIKENNPDHVCFICSQDSSTGQKGSYTQIDGKGNCIKAAFGDPSPTLPNIPTQCGMEPAAYTTLLVPSDELSEVFSIISEQFEKIRRAFPDAQFVADYTGGTKTMSAAIVLAASERKDVDIRLIAGRRADLHKVRDGSEFMIPVSIEHIRFNRSVEPITYLWQQYAYQQAVVVLNAIERPQDRDLRESWQFMRDMSLAFAAWDAFDHAEAEVLLRDYGSRIQQWARDYLATLSCLATPTASNHRAFQVWDLWLNAQRRAEQGCFDVALAVCYRLWEATAQWLLWEKSHINTACVTKEQLPDATWYNDQSSEPQKIGLMAAWKLLQHHHPDSAATGFFVDQHRRFEDLLQSRNGSLLAHGFAPVYRKDWDEIHTWMKQHFVPMLEAEFKIIGIKRIPKQLPNDYRSAELRNQS